jgi:hypothetical protein
MQKRSIFAAIAAVAVVSTAVYAQTEFPIFVGKGDVQLALGLNNNQLQNATLDFAMVSESETSWTCQKDGAANTQVRTRTTSTEGLVSHTERVRNQITGFWLTGVNGSVTVGTDGPALGSCPNGWTEVPESRETTEGGSGITVNGVAL